MAVDHLTAGGAARLKTILEEAGATVRIADDAEGGWGHGVRQPHR
jgi:hypothetical protein